MQVKLDSLRSLFEHELCELQSATALVVRLLPEFKAVANDLELQHELENQERKFREQLQQLEELLDRHGVNRLGHESSVLQAIGDRALGIAQAGDGTEGKVRDAAMVVALAELEHYCIIGYRSAAAMAEQLEAHESGRHLAQACDLAERAASDLEGLSKRWLLFVAAGS